MKLAPSGEVNTLNSRGLYAQLKEMPSNVCRVASSPVHDTTCSARWLPELHQYPLPDAVAIDAANAKSLAALYTLLALALSKLAYWTALPKRSKSNKTYLVLGDAFMVARC
jgi:hypothetical protein